MPYYQQKCKRNSIELGRLTLDLQTQIQLSGSYLSKKISKHWSKVKINSFNFLGFFYGRFIKKGSHKKKLWEKLYQLKFDPLYLMFQNLFITAAVQKMKTSHHEADIEKRISLYLKDAKKRFKLPSVGLVKPTAPSTRPLILSSDSE